MVLDRPSTRRGAAMRELLVSLSSNSEFIEFTASSRNSHSRPQRRSARGRAQICRLRGWRTALLIFLFCCLPFVLSGCSNRIAMNLPGTGTGTPTLTVETSSSPSTYGSAVTFTATISGGPTGTVTFYDGGASIGTGTINGTTATLTTSSLIAGSHTITASWPGNSSYSAVTSGAITQVVSTATPTITWNTPAAITYGTALSSTQLDASSTEPGTFV